MEQKITSRSDDDAAEERDQDEIGQVRQHVYFFVQKTKDEILYGRMANRTDYADGDEVIFG